MPANPPRPAPLRPQPTLARRWTALLAVAAVIALVWTVVLPHLAEAPAVRAMIDRNERLGIDPSALYYTDLEHLEFRDSMLRRVAPQTPPEAPETPRSP